MANAPEKVAPVIPYGTQPTVYGTPSFIPGNTPFAPLPKPPVEVQLPDPVIAAPQGYETQVGIQLTPELKAQGQTAAELAEKKGFKTAEDLAQSYVNLEAQKGRLEMGLNDALKFRQEALQVNQSLAVAQKVETQEDAINFVKQLVRNELQTVVRPLEDKVALQEFLSRNPDAPQFAGRIAAQIKENPGLSWDSAYKIVKFDTLQEQSREQGKKEAYQNVAQKQAAQVGQPRPQVQRQESSLAATVADKSIPWNEVQRIMKERFSQ